MATNPASGIVEAIVSLIRSINWLWLIIGAALGMLVIPRVLGR